MFRLLSAALAILLFVPAITEAGTLAKIDELERRFNEYDRRLTGIEGKIELLLDYLRQGQGAVISRPPEIRRPTGIEGAGMGNSPFSTTVRRRVMEDSTNVYDRPSAGSSIIARVNAGTWLDVRDRTENGSWYQVVLPGGQSGYIADRFLEPVR